MDSENVVHVCCANSQRLLAALNHKPADEKPRYVITSRSQDIPNTVANLCRYPIRRRVTLANALEMTFSPLISFLFNSRYTWQSVTINTLRVD